MKLNVFLPLLGGLLLASAPIQAQDVTPLQKSWTEVRELTAELDSLIANRKLSGVHDAALNVRDAVRDLRASGGNNENLDATIRRIDGLLDSIHETADHNDLRGTVRGQRQLHVLLDEISGLFPKGTIQPVGPVQPTGQVKDPVCRMTVDPATAAGKTAHAGQMYYFCSASEIQQFKQNPQRYAALYDELAFGKPKEFTVSLGTVGKVQPGKSSTLVFAVREKGKPQLVTEFQQVHEMLLHLIMVSDDLSWFSHEHPTLAKDGRFYLKWTPPRSGRYWMYADFTPANGGNAVVRSELRVAGGPVRKPVALTPDKTWTKTVDGVTATLKIAPELRAGRQTLLTYTLTRNGKPVTDMEPYLGAMGHLMAIHQNGRDAVHTHTVHPGDDPVTGLRVSSGMATASGPRQTFKLEVPTPGLYRVWAQFGVPGRILTVPFTLRVSPAMNLKTTALATGAIVAGSVLAAHAGPANHPLPPRKAPQKVTITLPEGYREGAATVKAGQPVKLTFFLKSDAGCGNTIALPAAKWKKDLKVGQKATVVYTPTKSGPLTYECGMGHMKGTLIVK